MKYLSLMSCLLVLLFSSCNEVNPKSEQEVREFLKQWNASHTALKAPYLERDYMPVVTYYGEERTRTQVQQDKKLLFQQFPNYTQRILNDPLTITKEAGVYLVTFTKRVSYNGIEADYTSYLSMMIRNGDFQILREGVAENSKDLDAPIFPSARADIAFFTNNRQLFGDFNGDGLSDYATVISPTTTMAQSGDTVVCKGECNSVITFSNKDLKAITIKGAYKSQLENLKDLNSDGADEIGFWDIKPTTKSFYVFDATNGALLSGPVVINTTVHKNLNLIDVFKNAGPNKITVTRSAQVNGKWILENETIALD
ncbi:hypothetical protein ES677_06335 [Bizionia gelidisalsuginis]|uniref:DUF4440 domain-containing protein n=2 Tax=Bizionia TaxID=283785 RepID=A0A8H2LDM7_9FLAO|nr:MULTISPECIES: hypothetical protein [Bizionia]TYB76651.1 hypothetical protein ES676_04715 [Bizionia saleffrena]TYC14156.1 hypothetical protein ES677_06335 [Bizionia gelidisalsuginis]